MITDELVSIRGGKRQKDSLRSLQFDEKKKGKRVFVCQMLKEVNLLKMINSNRLVED